MGTSLFALIARRPDRVCSCMASLLIRSIARSTHQRLGLEAARNNSTAAPAATRPVPSAGQATDAQGMDAILKADHSKAMMGIMHKTNLLAIGLTPIAFVMPSTSVPTTMINVFVGIVFPVHGHIGMTGVVTDYIPKFFGKQFLGPARMALFGLTSVTVLGLLKINLTGDGMAGTVKAMWTGAPEKK